MCSPEKVDSLYRAIESQDINAVKNIVSSIPKIIYDRVEHAKLFSRNSRFRTQCIPLMLNATKWYSQEDTDLIYDDVAWDRLKAYIKRVDKHKNFLKITTYNLMGFLLRDKETLKNVVRILFNYGNLIPYIAKRGKELGVPEIDLNNLRMSYVLYATKSRQSQILQHLLATASLDSRFRNGQNDNLLIMSIKLAMRYDVDLAEIGNIFLNTLMSFECCDMDGITTFEWIRQSRNSELIRIIREQFYPVDQARADLRRYEVD